MSQLGLIIKNEYLTDVRSKSFWISTIIVPIVTVVFGGIMGYLLSESDSVMQVQDSMMPDKSDITGLQAVGLMVGMLLTFFLMMYGSQIFQKVKIEKTNRIVEILATCVPGRTMMLAKIIAVGLTGLTQLLIWVLMVSVIIIGVLIVFPVNIPWDKLLSYDYIMAIVWSVLYFTGGYIFFGSLFAAGGALTDKNNENQEYVAVMTFILLGCLYISMYAVDHGDTIFVRILNYIPFTSPTIGAVNAVTQSSPLWETITSIVLLYFFAWLAMAFAGKLYTSSILLKGKRFTPGDIITFLRTK